LWNNLDFRIRNSSSIKVFKQSIRSFFDIQNYDILFDYSIDRYSAIIHTRLRLGCCRLNAYLFKINCITLTSPLCVCNTENESVLHYLLKCPRYAALRHNLLPNAAQVYGDDFLLLSEPRKVNILLRGSRHI
jgi:hypothetical protein